MLAADGHGMEAGASRPRFMECPQQKQTLARNLHSVHEHTIL